MSRQGFSFVETMITLGIIMSTILGGGLLVQSHYKVHTSTDNLISLSDVNDRIRRFLQDRTLCKSNFENLSMNSLPIDITQLIDAHAGVKFAAGSTYDNNITVTSMTLKDFTAHPVDPLRGIVTLEVAYQQQKKDLSSQDKLRTLSLNIDLDNAIDKKIARCVVGLGRSQLWQEASVGGQKKVSYSAGSVGVGVLNPAGALDVFGDVVFKDNASPPRQTIFKNFETPLRFVVGNEYNGGSFALSAANSWQSLNLYHDGTVRMPAYVALSGAQLGLVANSDQMRFITDTHQWEFDIRFNVGSMFYEGMRVGGTARTVFNSRAQIGTTSTSANEFFVNGWAGGSSTWAVVSDQSVKKNIKALSQALEKIKKLQGVRFKWNPELNWDSREHLGFIAQEVKKIIPQAVNSRDETLRLDDSRITPVLVEAVKELMEKWENSQADTEKLITQICSKHAKVKACQKWKTARAEL